MGRSPYAGEGTAKTGRIVSRAITLDSDFILSILSIHRCPEP